jgi:hypothetical protein
MSEHATFVGMIFVDLAAAATPTHLLIPGPFAARSLVSSLPRPDDRMLSPVLMIV